MLLVSSKHTQTETVLPRSAKTVAVSPDPCSWQRRKADITAVKVHTKYDTTPTAATACILADGRPLTFGVHDGPPPYAFLFLLEYQVCALPESRHPARRRNVRFVPGNGLSALQQS